MVYGEESSERDTVFLTLEEVYEIHTYMIKIGGGRGEIHDFSLLHSAIERPKAEFSGVSLYPTVWLKAAALMHSLVKNHPFDDGNKRTAYYSTKRFLYVNGFIVTSGTEEVVPFMVSVDVKNLELKTIADWLQAHATKRKK